MEDWIAQVCQELDIPRAAVDIDAILDLARDAAHSVARPAAPVTTYLLGYAAGRASVDPRSAADPDHVARWIEEIATQARARSDQP